MWQRAFVNGGLLSPRAQAELDSSFVRIPDLDTPFVRVLNGFALSKVVITGLQRGLPGLPDSQVIQDAGSLPGVYCFNAVVREHDSERTLAVGSMCQNGHGSGHPDLADLWFEFIRSSFAAN